eukprot:GHVT01058881.1.p1 GENE.GHVT01058881.1~~GHVT01058881.1.p1  ORF type:complete len:304 (-),score=18.92 GHVT01058881.1:3008-3919(-)
MAPADGENDWTCNSNYWSDNYYTANADNRDDTTRSIVAFKATCGNEKVKAVCGQKLATVDEAPLLKKPAACTGAGTSAAAPKVCTPKSDVLKEGTIHLEDCSSGEFKILDYADGTPVDSTTDATLKWQCSADWLNAQWPLATESGRTSEGLKAFSGVCDGDHFEVYCGRNKALPTVTLLPADCSEDGEGYKVCNLQHDDAWTNGATVDMSECTDENALSLWTYASGAPVLSDVKAPADTESTWTCDSDYWSANYYAANDDYRDDTTRSIVAFKGTCGNTKVKVVCGQKSDTVSEAAYLKPVSL